MYLKKLLKILPEIYPQISFKISLRIFQNIPGAHWLFQKILQRFIRKFFLGIASEFFPSFFSKKKHLSLIWKYSASFFFQNLLKRFYLLRFIFKNSLKNSLGILLKNLHALLQNIVQKYLQEFFELLLLRILHIFLHEFLQRFHRSL